jgi:hypothetical protein
LHVFSYLPIDALLVASFINRQWNLLANDQSLWKGLCRANKWEWKTPYRDTLGRNTLNIPREFHAPPVDEGFGDDEPEIDASGSSVVSCSSHPLGAKPALNDPDTESVALARRLALRHSSPAVLGSTPRSLSTPDYKALYRTRTILRRRLRMSNYRLTALHDPAHAPLSINIGAEPPSGHTSTIYSLCLASDPCTSEPTLYTASRDQRILQWDMSSSPYSRSSPVMVFQGEHVGSVLSICISTVHGFLISGGSDGRIVVWSLRTAARVQVLEGNDGHYDSVLCVRCDEKRIVSCSKGLIFYRYLGCDLAPDRISSYDGRPYHSHLPTSIPGATPYASIASCSREFDCSLGFPHCFRLW